LTTSAKANYKVSFGRTGRMLVYEDEAGILFFTFDCSPAKKETGKKWNLHLGRRALVEEGGKFVLLNGNSEVERERVATAMERVERYASSCGYLVQISEPAHLR
jgi:hypothetical protein